MDYFYLSIGLGVLTVLLIVLVIKKQIQLKKYSPIIDLKAEQKRIDNEISSANKDLEQLKSDYGQKREIYKKLLTEIGTLEEDLRFTEVGLYKPHYDYDTSEQFKEEIEKNREKQKELITSKEAVNCRTDWTVDGSKRKGQAMTNKNIKLVLRAFNGECDAAISKVKWNNISVMEARIEKAYDALNKLGEGNHIDINYDYYQLKLQELYLAHEYEEKKYEEKEEQRQIREQMREEERAQKEFEKAQKDAEKEEKMYEKALEKAKKEIESATEDKRKELEEQIKELQRQIEEAEEKRQRAISQAQLTRSGHVYVISNIGSFGDNVYKIGMTRRLEPIDRVKELGDASVPFQFDVHAMIYSTDAPTLENALHKTFENKRVNMVNNRKEFFNVTLNEIEEEVKKLDAKVEFTKLAEAKEYRESKSILEQLLNKISIDDVIEETFPSEL